MKTLVDQVVKIVTNNENQNLTFYKDYLVTQEEYKKLIEQGYTKPRGPITLSKFDDINFLPPSYNHCINTIL
ncbi:MAG: hypothetical protein J5798_10010 [Spirochaetaceae bacterium]|nr:hypothetical protein [Spirochaetaceae bacterium]